MKLATLLFSLWLAAIVNGADTFELQARTATIPEVGMVTNYSLTLSSNRLVFLPPKGWRLELDPPGKVILLQSPEPSVHIRIQAIPDPPGRTNAWTLDELRRKVQERFSTTNLLEEFPCYTGYTNGQGFDLARPVTNGAPQEMRVAWIPVSSNLVEFLLVMATNQAPRARLALGNLLTSFRVEPAGP